MAELLLAGHYGEAELERQRPLLAVDKGDCWRVEGSFNRDRKIEDRGPFFLSVRKNDGRVVDIGIWRVVHPHPSVMPLIEEHLCRKRTERP